MKGWLTLNVIPSWERISTVGIKLSPVNVLPARHATLQLWKRKYAERIGIQFLFSAKLHPAIEGNKMKVVNRLGWDDTDW